MTERERTRAGTWLTGVALALWGAGLVWHGFRPLADLDLWWNIRLGEQIVSTGTLLPNEVFSYTRADVPWVWKDWGTALTLFGLWSAGGIAAIVTLKAACLFAAGALLWVWLRRQRELPVALALLVGAICLDAASFRFTERGATISLVLLLVVVVLVERHRHGKSGLWWTVAVVAVNANVHRGVLFLPVLLGALAVVEVLEVRVLRRSARWRTSVSVAAASGVACLLTPFGTTIATTTITLMGQHSPLITEWAPVSPGLVWAMTPATFVVLVFAVIGVGVASWRGRDPWDAMLAVLALGLGLQSMRHLPYLALLAAGPGASALARIPNAWDGRLRHVIAIGAGAIALFAQLARPLPGPAFELAPAHFPHKGVAFIESLPERLRLRGPMFNDFGYGGFLIFHLWPEHRVYIDGRTDLVYPASAVERYIGALGDPEIFADEVDRFGIQWVIIDNAPPLQKMAHLDRNPSWVLVHASRRALVFVRRGGANAALAETRGYRYLWPNALMPSLGAAVQQGRGGAALAELERMVAEDPDNLYAVGALAQIRERFPNGLGGRKAP